MKKTVAPEDAPLRATPGNAPAPLGEAPSEDRLLDIALEYTFPASDPIAVDCHAAETERRDRPTPASRRGNRPA